MPFQSKSKSDSVTYAKLSEAALRLLVRREHSELELRNKLKQKFPREVLYPATHSEQAHASSLDAQPSYEPLPIQDALDILVGELINQDLLSDERFTENLINSRLRRGYGPLYVRRELQQKGVSEKVAKPHLDQVKDRWLDEAQDQIARRFPEAAQSRQMWAKAARFLERRGFDRGTISELLGRIPEESEGDSR